MKYKTCVSVAEETPEKTMSALKKALLKSEYAEIRFDYLDQDKIPEVLEKTKTQMNRLVCTLRPKSEGGRFRGSEKERISILKLISEYEPFLLDVEYSTLVKNNDLKSYLRRSECEILVSWHDFKKTPNLQKLYQKFLAMKKFSNNIKIVTSAKSIEDTSTILSLYEKSGKTKLIAFAMGDSGRISRILCLFLGAPYSYVSLGKPVAPGQFSVEQTKKLTSIRAK